MGSPKASSGKHTYSSLSLSSRGSEEELDAVAGQQMDRHQRQASRASNMTTPDSRGSAPDDSVRTATTFSAGDSDDEERDALSPAMSPPQSSAVVGIVAALFNGVWGGANLVPSHFSPLGGIHFAISFATGALLANIVIMTVYILLAKCYWR